MLVLIWQSWKLLSRVAFRMRERFRPHYATHVFWPRSRWLWSRLCCNWRSHWLVWALGGKPHVIGQVESISCWGCRSRTTYKLALLSLYLAAFRGGSWPCTLRHESLLIGRLHHGSLVESLQIHPVGRVDRLRWLRHVHNHTRLEARQISWHLFSDEISLLLFCWICPWFRVSCFLFLLLISHNHACLSSWVEKFILRRDKRREYGVGLSLGARWDQGLHVIRRLLSPLFEHLDVWVIAGGWSCAQEGRWLLRIWVEDESRSFDLLLLKVIAGCAFGRLVRLIRSLGLRAAVRQETWECLAFVLLCISQNHHLRSRHLSSSDLLRFVFWCLVLIQIDV